MRRIAIALFIIVIAVVSAAGCGKKVPTIGISQYGEHASLDNCREGFIEGLVDAGLTEGKDFKVDYQNAAFDDAIASQIAQNFSSNNVALMLAIATPSATACYAAAEDKDIPVVFSAISDPVKAKLDSGNVTGTSDKLPVEAQLDLIRRLQPEADSIGIIYTSSEINSVSTIAEYEQKAAAYGFTIMSIGIMQQSEVTLAADSLISKGVDCFSNLTDNNVVGVLPSMLEKTREAGIPVYGSEVEQVKIGCVAAAGIDYFELGRQTGAIAARILKKEAKASEIPYETISEYGIYINSSALEEMGIMVPSDIADRAIEANN
ncbi:MAG TPA: ABC transporter substrate-binding protein [Bacillota bacterium]|nr:ABC transporter substrate-binding protein [Bacillota bacterium]